MIFYIFNELFKFLEKNKIGNKFPPYSEVFLLFRIKNLIPVIESLLYNKNSWSKNKN